MSADQKVVRELVEQGDVVSAAFVLIEQLKLFENTCTAQDPFLLDLTEPSGIAAALQCLVGPCATKGIQEASLIGFASDCLRRVAEGDPTSEASSLLGASLVEQCERAVDHLPTGSDAREVVTGLLAYEGILFVPTVLRRVHRAIEIMFAQHLLATLPLKRGDAAGTTLANLTAAAVAAAVKVSRWTRSILTFINGAVNKYGLRDGAVQYIETTSTQGGDNTPLDGEEDEGEYEEDLERNALKGSCAKKLILSPYDLSRHFFVSCSPVLCPLLTDLAACAINLTGSAQIAEHIEEAGKADVRVLRRAIAATALNVQEMLHRAKQFSSDDGDMLDARSIAVEEMDMSNLARDANIRRLAQPAPIGMTTARPANFAYPCNVFMPRDDDLRVTKQVMEGIAERMDEVSLTRAEGLVKILERASEDIANSQSDPDSNSGRGSRGGGRSHISRSNLFDDVLHESYDVKPFDASSNTTNHATSDQDGVRRGGGRDETVEKQMRKVQDRQARADLVTFLSDDDDNGADAAQCDDSISMEADYPSTSVVDRLLGSILVPADTEAAARLPRSVCLLHLPTVFLVAASGFSAMLRSESLALVSHGLALLDELATRSPKFAIHIAVEDMLEGEQSSSRQGIAEGCDEDSYDDHDGDATQYRSKAMRQLFTVLHDLVNLVVLSPSSQHRRCARNVLSRVLLMLHSATRRRCVLSLLAASPYSSLCVVLLTLIKQEVLQNYKQLLALPTQASLVQVAHELSFASSLPLVLCLSSCLGRWVNKVKNIEKEFCEPLVFGMNLLRLWVLNDFAAAKRLGTGSGVQFNFFPISTAADGGIATPKVAGLLHEKRNGKKKMGRQGAVDQIRRDVLEPLAALLRSSSRESGESSICCAHSLSVNGRPSSLSPVDLFSLLAAVEGLERLFS